jgi:hypothetical protein
VVAPATNLTDQTTASEVAERIRSGRNDLGRKNPVRPPSLVDFLGEIAFYACVCAVGGLAIFVWRAHPLLTVLLALGFAAVVAWMGYRLEAILRPEGSRLRRLATSALALGSVGLAAYLLWISLCSCA